MDKQIRYLRSFIINFYLYYLSYLSRLRSEYYDGLPMRGKHRRYLQAIDNQKLVTYINSLRDETTCVGF